MLPLVFLLAVTGGALCLDIPFSYHDYPSMTRVLHDLHDEYPHMTSLYTVGKSGQGRELWVLLITREPESEPTLKPNVKYIANMHGNEAVGREMLLHLADHLLSSYGQDEYVTWLLDNTRVHLMPSMNPDGFEASTEGQCSGTQGRGNSHSFDLNRNFPDYFTGEQDRMQPETRAVMRWMSSTQFVLSANLHGGALVASYPFDNVPPNTPKGFRSAHSPSPTPDDDVFRYLAQTYSFSHKNMYAGASCRDGTPEFENGTTNGAAWYPLKGGMQDYNYVWAGCMEITLEISCCKYPRAHRLPQFWEDNRLALLKYLGEAHQGVWGVVTDSNNNPLRNVSIKIQGRQFGSRTTSRGEYWRILRPGTYTLQAFADGYEPAELIVRVSKGVTLQNITLYPLSTTLYEPRSDPTLFRSGHNSAAAVWPTLTVNHASSHQTTNSATTPRDTDEVGSTGDTLSGPHDGGVVRVTTPSHTDSSGASEIIPHDTDEVVSEESTSFRTNEGLTSDVAPSRMVGGNRVASRKFSKSSAFMALLFMFI